jgi:hypothetical protein
MFNLMTGTDRLPVEEGSIVQIHKGMNKLRVSVGDHISEPSEVFIVTGDDEGLFRSFIVFFMVEPEIHVVYGYEENPYPPERREEVLRGAFRFLEEMGAILEEVPWDEMSGEERAAWTAGGVLYPPETFDDEVVEIEELEEIRPGELLEILEEIEPGRGIGTDETGGGGEVPGGRGEHGRDEEGGGLTEEDRDFDQLLKQAFLKPDLLEKSMARRDQQDENESVGDDVSDSTEEEPVAEPDNIEMEEPETPGGMFEEPVETLFENVGGEERLAVCENAVPSGAAVEPPVPDKGRGLAVIRFLSRF